MMNLKRAWSRNLQPWKKPHHSKKSYWRIANIQVVLHRSMDSEEARPVD